MMKKCNYPVEGLGCAACVARVEKALQSVEGVEEVSVSLASNMAQVSYDEAKTGPERLREAVQAAGYDLILPEEKSKTTVLSEVAAAQAAAEAAASPEEEAERRAQAKLNRMKEGCLFCVLVPDTRPGAGIPAAGPAVTIRLRDTVHRSALPASGQRGCTPHRNPAYQTDSWPVFSSSHGQIW